MPLAVKLLAVALAVLGVVYGLTVFRDRRPTSVAPAVIDAAVR
jgi:hypothetical protein